MARKTAQRYSKPYKRGRRLFRYDYENAIVEWVSKATEEEYRDNAEWESNHPGRRNRLWDIGEDGLISHEGVGLRKENWENKEARNEYLDEWNFELDEESEWLYEEFKREFEGGI